MIIICFFVAIVSESMLVSSWSNVVLGYCDVMLVESVLDLTRTKNIDVGAGNVAAVTADDIFIGLLVTREGFIVAAAAAAAAVVVVVVVVTAIVVVTVVIIG
jgi:hypothetical protein